jgi:hypothetical protein
MKKIILTLIVFVLPVFAQAPSIPTKAFAVRNGNGVVDNGTTYTSAIVIPFKDAAAKQKFLDDVAEANNWANQVPQQPKQQFVLDVIQNLLKQQAKAGRDSAQATVPVDVTDLP